MSGRGRFVHLGGRGKFHVDVGGVTACGKPVTYPVKTTVYPCHVCSRCERDTEAYADAEAFRKQAFAKGNDEVTRRRNVERRGIFTVYRCRLCGTQHHTHPDRQQGVPYCMTANHVADLEAVIAQGPAWVGPEASA